MEPTIRTARLTGLAYLGLAVTGVLGFLLIRPDLFVPGDGAATLANIMAAEHLARLVVVAELGAAGTQALTALLFYRLFRTVNPLAAGALAVFGMVNAVVILGSSAMLTAAVAVVDDPSAAPGGDVAATVQLLYLASDGLWAVGGVFFGAWLVPMGWLVIRSRCMPVTLGWILIAGGVGYVLSAAVGLLLPAIGVLTQVLTVPATVGEFWILGYLLVIGVRRRASGSAPVAAVT